MRSVIAERILDATPIVVAVVLLIAIAITFPGCASVPRTPSVLEQFSGTLEGVCNVWEVIRDAYPEMREDAKLLRELGEVDDKTWSAFVWIDENAKDLNRWLALVCAARAGEPNAHVLEGERAAVDWNAVGAAVLRVASFAISRGIL